VNDIKVPYRTRIYDLSCGDKQIHIHINGRLALVLNYDPRNNVLTECDIPRETKPGDDIETKTITKG
jgi:hypothetical protein